MLVGLIVVLAAEFVMRFFLPDGFGGAARGDEVLFRRTWLSITDSSVDLADRIDGYAVLTTPLSLVVFGVAERIGGGLWAARLIATACACVIVVLAWRSADDQTVRLQVVAGVLAMPHFLRSSTVAYTDPVAVLFAVLGLLAYHRGRHRSSAVWFALGIASRQFIVAFPVAILVWEGIGAWRSGERSPAAARPLVPYGVASATVLGWFVLFGGLATTAASNRIGNVPEVQQTVGALDPEAGLFFLSVLGLMFVVPEFLIAPSTSLLARPVRRTTGVALAALVALAVVFPFNPNSAMWGLGSAGLSDSVEFVLFLSLAALAVMRFAEWSFPSVLVGVHAVMLMKAYPWSKYALPVIVALWFLKGLESATRSTVASRRDPSAATPVEAA